MDLTLHSPGQIIGTVPLPLSKSLSNRALLIDALCEEHSRLTVADCDDTAALRHGLTCRCSVVNVGAAGTAMRFLTAFLACHKGRTAILDGSARMRQRPIGPLVEALRNMGAAVHCLEREGYPPLHIEPRRLKSDELTIPGSVSSQFISALLLIAPVCGGMRLHLSGKPTSRPYIDMTLGVMRHFGAEAWWDGGSIMVSDKPYTAHPFVAEADWSAASYWYALTALMPQSRVRLKGLRSDSLQGDSAIARLMKPLGVDTHFTDEGAEISHSTASSEGPVTLEMTDTPDIAQTMAVTLCLKQLPFRLDGVHTLRIKETDRIAALCRELKKLGYNVQGNEHSIWWDGQCSTPETNPAIDTYNDHRMAMAFAPAAISHPGVTIRNAQVVSKSYPDFWQHLSKAGFDLKQLATGE